MYKRAVIQSLSVPDVNSYEEISNSRIIKRKDICYKVKNYKILKLSLKCNSEMVY